MEFLTRSCTCLLTSMCLLGVAHFARAESRLPDARVVWVRGDRVYVASPDSVFSMRPVSNALEPGAVLTFKDRGKSVAVGEVEAVYNADLIAVVLTSGSLKRVKHLKRLEIFAGPPVFHAPPVLRLGYPALGRKNLLFDCSNQSLAAWILGVYKADTTSGQLYRLVRDSTYSVSSGWPDTLLLRRYDEIADEEIALERGELDAAIFWPGEASTHIRDVMRWQRRPPGRPAQFHLAANAWSRGVAIDSTSLRADERRALSLLNQELFREDLTSWIENERREADAAPAPVEVPAPPKGVSARFEVDASIPGREQIERFLNRAMGSTAASGAGRVVRLRIVGAPRETFGWSATLNYVFGIRCPVISTPKLRAYVEALGTEALVNIFGCAPPRQKP